MSENKIDYPRFISNKACGEDKTEGSSQERLADAIAEHIVSTDTNNNEQNLSRIIGLKGEWGTGKTNVIKQLKKNEQIKDKYYIFEYDAWGHQEDLQRRSFLETLTAELLNDNNDFLQKNKKVVKSWETGQKISWQQKLNELLAHRRITDNKSIPVFNAGALWTALCLLSTPISVFISERLESQKIIECIPLLTLIAFSPILLGIIIWFITMIFNKDARSIGYLLRISKKETTQTRNIETINEDEPTVLKFNKWMTDLSDYIHEYKKQKLIIVYDNMDRLPADKVKELWSSIHTFFSENGFDNIWVIIPFDEAHLSCAFGESDKKEELTKHFISKTFPIVYRVTPPVITDYKGLFDDLFIEAFGTTESPETHNTIFRIFRIEKPNATIREIIEFINQLVTLKRIWGDEIDLSHSAVFITKEKKILENPVNQILSGNYLGNYINNIVANNEDLQTSISALVYGIPKELAKQIPMKKYIESCFDKKENDINTYSQSSLFISILLNSVQDGDDAKLDGIIKALSKLKVDSFENNDKVVLTSLWDELVNRKEKQKFTEQKFDESHKILLLRISDKEGFVERMCGRIQNFQTLQDMRNDIGFSGSRYYNALKAIEECIAENNLNIDVSQFLEEKRTNVENFVDYVKVARDDYTKFKLFTDNSDLNEYFFKKNYYQFDDLSILKYIKKDDKNYNFDVLKQKIEEFIPNKELDATNFKKIFDAYKIISDDKPLKKQLLSEQRIQIWDTLSNQTNNIEYLEIAAIRLANNENITKKLSEEQIEYVANQMDYYADYGSLLKLSATDNANLISVLRYMTEHKLENELILDNILPKFFEIKNKIGVTESVLLLQLNNCKNKKEKISKDNIQQIIPNADFFIHSKETKNLLTDHINKTAIEALANIDKNTLYSQLGQPSSYWYKVVEALIDTDFCKPLPDNLFNLGVNYLTEVVTKGVVPQDNDLRNKIINKLDNSKTGSTILEIRDLFCNSLNTINNNNFLYLESRLRLQGELKKRSTEVVLKIIHPVIDDTNCLNLIIENSNFYADIFNSASGIEATKEKIQEKVNSSEDPKLIEFAKKIGIAIGAK